MRRPFRTAVPGCADPAAPRRRRAPRRRLALAGALAAAGFLALPATAATTSASQVGSWQVLSYDSRIIGINTALLHTGEVLVMAGSENIRTNFDAGSFRSETWDPVTGTITPVLTPEDIFCSGHAQLPDGRLLLAGGVLAYPDGSHYFYGSRSTLAFDPATRTYSELGDMAAGRWYPTLVTLGNGDVLAMGGLSDGTTPYADNRTPEVFSATTQQWRSLPSSPYQWPLYPHLLLMSNGKVLFTGGNVFGTPIGAGVLDVESNTLSPVTGLSAPDQRDQAASVLLPPAQRQQFMVIGGGAPGDGGAGTANVDTLDLGTSSSASYQPAQPLPSPRVHVTAVLLPDRTVLVTGGAAQTNTGVPDHTTRIYDPETNTWRSGADNQVARLYHSTGLLLPDGRVATFGSQVGNNPYSPESAHELRIEVYSPPYMFQPDRPSITGFPSQVGYGGTMSVGLKSKYGLRSASLIRPSAVTHSFDSEQRVVDLPVKGTQKNGKAVLALPSSSNIAPPGWYMLVLNDNRRVPTPAAWVHLG